MDIIKKYFPTISINQENQFSSLYEMYREWNAKINVISRKDIDHLYEHHILHSLGIAKFLKFKPGTSILDVGTGGGFPGIPLAIMFPESNFTLIDSIGKKIKVTNDIAARTGLTNTVCKHCRAEEERGKFDFIVSRAVMPLKELVKTAYKNLKKEQHNAICNGFILLKGGDLHEEINPYKSKIEIFDLKDYFDEDYFDTKKIVYLPV